MSIVRGPPASPRRTLCLLWRSTRLHDGGRRLALASSTNLFVIEPAFIVTAVALAPRLLALCGMPADWVWLDQRKEF